MTKETLTICNWCREPIQSGAPKVQTTTVDADYSYRPRGVPVVSRVRSYHTDRDCYRQSRLQSHQAGAKNPTPRPEPMSKEAISQDAYDWSETFGLSTEQALTGQGKSREERRRRVRRVAGLGGNEDGDKD